jgi:predicted alpha/beta-hydrolase family hydrolase
VEEAPSQFLIDTPAGEARVHLDHPSEARAALLLGHGAGGGIEAPDLLAAREAALALRLAVARVEQPYRVAGRRATPPVATLDSGWTTVAATLLSGPLAGLPCISGGRSSGARVACRTAAAVGAQGVVCLAFPLQPPRRRRDGTLAPNRLAELESVTVPMLIVQGKRDQFGVPPPAPGRDVLTVAGDHSLRAGLEALRSGVAAWVAALLSGAPSRDGATP